MQKKLQVETTALGCDNKTAILELTVNNHPGVMSHICGLFSRRAYNLEGIICLPIERGDTSRMWLKVDEEDKLVQVIKQIEKLPDVISVKNHKVGHMIFSNLQSFL